jgi:hypothetical protein
MSFSVAATALRGDAFRTEDTEGNEAATRFYAWAMLAVRYGLRVVGLRTELYTKSTKDPMHAKMVMPVLEGQNEIPATDDLDDVMEKLDTHMATKLMKAAVSLHAINAAKRSGYGGAASK